MTKTVALAEGVASDSRGQVTLVALEPQCWTPTGFPAPVTFGLAIVLESDGEPADRVSAETSITVAVRDPDGAALFFEEARDAQPRSLIDFLPPRVLIVLNLSITVTVPGAHTVSVDWTRLDEHHSWIRELRVMEPQQTTD